MRWLRRFRARRRIDRKIGLWYHPDYAPSESGAGTEAARFALRRPQMVLADLSRDGYLVASDIHRPAPATTEQLTRVHPIHYLEATDTPGRLSMILGVEPADIDVGAVLHSQRLAVGGTIAAARSVAGENTPVAMNLGGGFHHAAPDAGGGFCVYNDIAIAIAVLRREGLSDPIAIVDLDYHQGDGNLATFANDQSVLTYSIHGSVWSHIESEKDVGILLPTGTDDATYLAELQTTLPPALREHRPRITFVIAGNDVLDGDALGDFSLTPDGVLRRDRFVLDQLGRVGSRAVITLGGGYGPDAWHATANLVRWLVTGSAKARHHEEVDLRAEFTRISRRINAADLQAEDFELSEDDILEDLRGRQRAHRVLGFYSPQGVEYALERYGILESLRSLGFTNLRVEVDPRDPDHQSVRLLGSKDDVEHMLVELVIRRRTIEDFDLLSVEWMKLQNPVAAFSLERPPLPGQDHPGLGLAEMVVELLVQACRRLQLDGLVSHPSRFHIAVGMSGWQFLDPVVEARFRAMEIVLAGHDIVEAARIMEDGLETASGERVSWEPADRVLAVSPRLVGYVSSTERRNVIRKEKERLLDHGLHVPKRSKEAAS